VVVTHRGTRTGANATNKGMHIEQWVRKSRGPMLKFDPQQEKEMYQQTRKEILGPNWIASTSSTPPMVGMSSVYDRTILERSLQ
jgi:hypothetical protein